MRGKAAQSASHPGRLDRDDPRDERAVRDGRDLPLHPGVLLRDEVAPFDLGVAQVAEVRGERVARQDGVAHLAHRAERAGPFLAEGAAVGDDGSHHLPLALDDLSVRASRPGIGVTGMGLLRAARPRSGVRVGRLAEGGEDPARRRGRGARARGARPRAGNRRSGRRRRSRSCRCRRSRAPSGNRGPRGRGRAPRPDVSPSVRSSSSLSRGPSPPASEGGAQIEVSQGFSTRVVAGDRGVTNGDVRSAESRGATRGRSACGPAHIR